MTLTNEQTKKAMRDMFIGVAIYIGLLSALVIIYAVWHR